jgi:hypothetical protein
VTCEHGEVGVEPHTIAAVSGEVVDAAGVRRLEVNSMGMVAREGVKADLRARANGGEEGRRNCERSAFGTALPAVRAGHPNSIRAAEDDAPDLFDVGIEVPLRKAADLRNSACTFAR